MDVAAIDKRFHEVKDEIAQKCATDSEFRDALLANPNKTIEEEYELEPGSLSELKFQVVVEEDSVVLPIPPDVSEMELSDEQLDQVAGGGFFTVGLTIAVIGAAASVTTTAAVVTQRTRAGRRW